MPNVELNWELQITSDQHSLHKNVLSNIPSNLQNAEGIAKWIITQIKQKDKAVQNVIVYNFSSRLGTFNGEIQSRK